MAKDKQPKTHIISEAAGLSIGDYVEEDGFIWRVQSIKGVFTVQGMVYHCRRLNYFERVKMGFRQWLKRRKEKKNGNVSNNTLASS